VFELSGVSALFAFINQPVTSLNIDDNNPAVAGQTPYR